MATTISALSFTTLYPGLGVPAVTGAQQLEGEQILPEESLSIVQLQVPNKKALDKLVEMGIDLTHRVHQHGEELDVDVVVTPSEIEELRKHGITVKETLITEAQWNQRTAERNAAVQQESTIAAAEDTIKVLRANHYTNQSATFLYVEAKSSAGTSASTALTAKWVENGVEKTASLSRFVDYGEYMYHWMELPVTAIPESITISSNLGGSATSAVTQWLGEDKKGSPKKHYVKDFVDHYMDPYELYERAEKLAKEFPDLVEIIEMPNKTNGYRRLAQATIGSVTNSAVVVSSKAWGHEGGNDITVEFKNPGKSSQPLTVTVDDSKVIVDLATDSSGKLISTASQVVSALNSKAGNLVTATTYRGNTGTGIVAAGSAKLSDNLNAPAHIAREPQTVKAIRIGKHRDGSKPGVLGYAQEHAREWVTPLVTIETAERLLRNYAHDGETKQLVNNLDIFLIPSVNPDGALYSFYDYNMQRKNMTNHCGPTQSDPGNRNGWGVDLNRNHSVGSVFDGYVGASNTNCLSSTYAGPAENSEPESRNLIWLADKNPNIKFAMNIHSYGGYFMWSPGAYNPKRETLPRPTAGQEAFYWAASNEILNDIQDHRGTVILPSRTGPIPDVLYSAAGNSADYLWYEKGIYAWNFEVGADLWDSSRNRWSLVGFQPPFEEGHEEAMEFANGLIGLIKVAYNQSKDKQPPSTKAVPGNGTFQGPVEVAFETSEAATIYYTLDGTRPTFQSAHLRLSGTREPAETLKIDKTTVLNWFAVDAAGNIEKSYNPLNNSANFNSVKITIK
ncbi:zinc carboxypeptidase [Neobacillus piezotolerans]|uniref:Zinc carboxypeptidase n=2 Tax=Neobacillus piezotolerans TaxID=2259171 RepID=A0A3D8GX77_9BACI|nr:zinc carboxypeptidase [Neobacillus piezotolerans]